MPRSYEDWEAPEYPVAAPEWELGQLRRRVQVLEQLLRGMGQAIDATLAPPLPRPWETQQEKRS